MDVLGVVDRLRRVPQFAIAPEVKCVATETQFPVVLARCRESLNRWDPWRRVDVDRVLQEFTVLPVDILVSDVVNIANRGLICPVDTFENVLFPNELHIETSLGLTTQ